MANGKLRTVGPLGLLLFVCLVARLTSVAQWPRCGGDASCDDAMNIFSMLGAAFPNVLVYPIEVLTGNAVVIGAILLALNGGFLALVWRFLPRSPSWAASLGLLGIWIAGSLVSFWFAPHLVLLSAEVVMRFDARN